MIEVGYFSNQFADLEGHGIARYSRELFVQLSHLDALRVHPVASWSSVEGRALEDLQAATGLQILPWGRRLTPLSWAMLDYPPMERWLPVEPDLVHAVSLGYPVATMKPYVVTVHDLGPLTHPHFFRGTNPRIMRASLRQALKRASRIICVSRSTADELLAVAGPQVSARVEVIYEGVSAPFIEREGVEASLTIDGLDLQGAPYVLSTGKLSPRKNIAAVINAMSSLAAELPHHLVLVGGDGWSTEEIYSTLERTSMRDRVHVLGYVADHELRNLYSHASAYVHPSLYEGFGLTVLEAMACGCPVVTSNTTSLPEVAGDAALLIDPASTPQLAGAIRRVCSDSALAAELRCRGLERVRAFKWTDCATRVAEIYAEVVC